MKHCVIKVVIVAALGFFALPRIYAQDTTITIYGKKFAPDVIVKLNGTTISPANIRHDSLKPSRILYVTIPLSMLQTPNLVAVGKDQGASLSSTSGENILTVENPGQIGTVARYTIVAVMNRRSPLAILAKNSTLKDTIKSGQIQVSSQPSLDTALILTFKTSPGMNKKIVFRLDSTNQLSKWKIVDSLGNPLSLFNLADTIGMIPFRVQYISQDTAVSRIKLTITAQDANGNDIRTEQTGVILVGTKITAFPLLLAYTDSASATFFKENVIPGRIANPADFLAKTVTYLNFRLDSMLIAGRFSKLTRTRFSAPQIVYVRSYREQSPEDSINTDILALINGIAEIRTAQSGNLPVILLAHSDATPYKAITSSCTPNTFPPHMIVESKYARDFIDHALRSISPFLMRRLEEVFNRP